MGARARGGALTETGVGQARGHLESSSFQEPAIPEPPEYSLGEHKTTELTKVLSESDVYFASFIKLEGRAAALSTVHGPGRPAAAGQCHPRAGLRARGRCQRQCSAACA